MESSLSPILSTQPSAPSNASKPLSQDLNYTYAVVGTLGMFTNVFILAVLISDRKFLKQSANIAGIALSSFMCALAMGAGGYYRFINYLEITQPSTAWSCAMRIYPTLLPFAFQSMGVMLVVVGVERFSVFMFPNWYRTWWTSRRNWQVIGACYACLLVAFAVGFYLSWYAPNTTRNCGYTTVMGKEYFIYGMSVSAAGGTCSVALTLFGLIKGTRSAKSLPLLSGEAGRYRRQLKLTQSMLSVAICDFCLVVIPSVLYILSTITPEWFTSVNMSNITNLTYTVNTFMFLWPYLAFHKQFRAAAMNLIRCASKPSQIVPNGLFQTNNNNLMNKGEGATNNQNKLNIDQSFVGSSKASVLSPHRGV